MVEKGFDLVSVRDITGAVHANVAAVNYHFGSREGLMELVMSHVMEPLEAARLEVIKDVSSVGDILAGYVKALMTAAERVGMDKIFFMKLAGRVLVFPAGLMSQALVEVRSNMSQTYLQALRNAEVDAAGLEEKWSFFEAGLGQSLIQLKENLDLAIQLESWIDFGLLGLSGEKATKVVAKVVKAPVIEKIVEPKMPKPDVIEAVVSQGVDATPDHAAEVVPEALVEEVPEAKPGKAKPKKPKKSDDQAMFFDF